MVLDSSSLQHLHERLMTLCVIPLCVFVEREENDADSAGDEQDEGDG